jgi:hypothetical protein
MRNIFLSLISTKIFLKNNIYLGNMQNGEMHEGGDAGSQQDRGRRRFRRARRPGNSTSDKQDRGEKVNN